MGEILIEKTNGGLGRTALNTDGISGYIANGVAVVGGVQLGTVYKLGSIDDAAAIGINAAYDTANVVLVYNDIKEYFRFTTSPLYIMLVAQTVTMTEMCDVANTQYLHKLLTDAGGEIKQVAVARHYPSGATPVTTGGLDNDVLTVNAGPPVTRTGAIIKAQALADAFEAIKQPVLIIIQGRGFNGTAANAPDLRACGARNVAVTIAADLDVNGAAALLNASASVGTSLGCTSAAKVNESIGWVEKFNILSEAQSLWLKPGLSSNLALSTYSYNDLKTLESKGYIIPKIYVDYSGVFHSDSPTCVDLTDDYAYMENIRTINKGIRGVNKALTPKINSPVLVDKTSGQVSPDVAKDFENTARGPLKQMERDGEVSGESAFVDPAQNILSTSQILVAIELTPYGTARTLKAKIGFANPFKN